MLSINRRVPALVLLALLAAFVPLAQPVFAASFVVNSTDNAGDANTADGTCLTSGGVCTLRAAIQQANAAAGPHTISFNIPTSDAGYSGTTGVWSIRPATALPALTASNVTINGSTQPAGGTPAAGPRIMIDGSLNTNMTAGIRIQSSGNTIRGLIINNMRGTSIPAGIGVYLEGDAADNNTILENWLGPDATGTTAVASMQFYGVFVRGGDNNQIRGNVISGNGRSNIGSNVVIGYTAVDGAPSQTVGNIIAGNYIGTNAFGTAVIGGGGNPQDGVLIGYYAQDTVLGGATAADRNVIAGHTVTIDFGKSGVRIIGVNNSGTIVQGNYIGTNSAGSAAIANLHGVSVAPDLSGAPPSGVQITGNVISGNLRNGVNLDAAINTISGVTVQNNIIGLSAANAVLNNAWHGIALYNSGSGSGGVNTTVIRGNTISANSINGILIGETDAAAPNFTGNTVAGNYIGTLPGGASTSLNLTNGESGIRIIGGTGNTIGGTTAADRNIIAARTGHAGIRLGNATTSATTITGNYIGLNAAGNAALLSLAAERASFGILIETGSANNIIGGSGAGAMNVISRNNTGIQISGSGSTGNSVRGNRIGRSGDGSALLGNTQFGIWLLNASGNTIGGLAAGEGNSVADSSNHGIYLNGTSANNSVLGNTVSQNVQDGIHLSGAGVTNTTIERNISNANTRDGVRVDAATGARISRTTTSGNGGQGILLINNGNTNRAAPTLNPTLTVGGGGEPRVTGTATGCSAPGCVIEIFTSTTRDDGEGPRYLPGGTADPGTGAFSIEVTGCDPFLTATARDPVTNNTSPFTSPMINIGTGCSAATPLLSAGTPASNAVAPQIVSPGNTISYQHTLTNVGGAASTFTIARTLGAGAWPAALSRTSILLNPGASTTIFMTVTVPLNAAGGPPPEATTLTATAVTGGATDSEVDYTQAPQIFGVNIEPPRSLQFTPSPTAFLDYTHTITNTGNGVDTITLSATNINVDGSPGFTFPGGATCTLNPGQSCTRTVRISLGTTNTGGTFRVTATSSSAAVNDSVVNTVFSQSVIPQITTFARRDAFPGETVTFAHTVTNVGTQDGNFTPNLILPTPLDGWAVTTDAPASFFLAAGASRTVNVTMVVPAISATGAISGTEKTATIQITATESGAQASANDTVRVLLQPQFTFSAATISPASGFPLSTVIFTHTLQNTSNGDDRYSITVTPSAGLENVTITPASPVSVPRQGSVEVVIRARIRSGTAQSVGIEQLGIAVQSLSTPDPGIQNQTDAVTVLGAAVPSLSVTPGSRTTNQPGTATFNYTLTNTGNQAGNFDAPVFTLPNAQPGWVATIQGGSPPACFTGLAAGGTCNFTVDITVPAGAFAGVNQVRAVVTSATTPTAVPATATVTVTVNPTPGVTITPDRNGSGEPGTPISYSHTLTNTGNITDTFTFTTNVPAGWTAPPPVTLTAVPPGGVRNFVVIVTPPEVITAGTIGVVTVTATSGTSPNPADQVVDTTTIAAVDRATLTPADQTATGAPGNVVFFYPTLRNTGSTTIPYSLTVTTAGWTTLVTPTLTGPLAPGATVPVTVSVSVPPGTPIGVDNPTTLRVTRGGTDTPILATGQYTATTRPLGDLLTPLVNNGSGLPGSSVVYTHTLKNVSGADDTFTLRTIATNGWNVSVAPPSVFLEAGASRLISVTVVIPPGRPAGEPDVSYVEVQSVSTPSLNARGTENTTVLQFAASDLSPAQVATVEPGDTITFQQTLRNTGNALDTYTLGVDSMLGWPVTIIVPAGDTVSLLPNNSFPVEIRVQVPTTITPGTFDQITVTATSGNGLGGNSEIRHVAFYPPLPEQIILYRVALPLVVR